MNYRTKAISSFNTKLDFFIFNQVITESSRAINWNEFHSFEISEDLVKLYSTEYWQQKEEYKIKNKMIADIYKEMALLKENNKSSILEIREKYITETFPNLFPKTAFDKVVSKAKCHYCGITTGEIEKLADERKLYKKNLRGWKLELDRFNSNFEYSEKNCVMACYWCNNAKTDEFTEEEFLRIGKAISTVWKQRLDNDNR